MPGSEQAVSSLYPSCVTRSARAACRSIPTIRHLAVDSDEIRVDFVRIGSHVHHNRQTNHQVRHATFTLTFLTFT